MTNEDVIIAILLLVFIIAQTWLLARSTASSHRGAPEPSRLPPPPKPAPSGPWYLHIVFTDRKIHPDIWIKADDIQSIEVDSVYELLTVTLFSTGRRSFEYVSCYDFVQLSQMGDVLFAEDDVEQ